MPALTPAELATLRSQLPHTAEVKWYLAVAPYGDATFTAQVNDAGIAQGEREIVYDNDVGENTVSPGMTLWIGSTPNAYDLGRLRIRSINTGTNTITVAENDDVLWADDLYLTCPGAYGFRELWGIYSRITEAGGVVTFYEDYDVLYQNPLDDILPPKANAGPPVCEFLGVNGYVDVSFTGDESFTTEIGAGIASYSWDFADGVIQSGAANQAGTCASPNVIRFSTPGFRYVSLTVTDNTGQARTGIVYIPVWIFNRTTSAPSLAQVINQAGDPSWKFSIKAFSTEGTPEDVFYNYPDGALIVLFTETTYPDNSANLGGFCYRENIRFVGWLDTESLSFDYDSGTVQFDAISHDARLAKLPGFAYTLLDSTSPSDWYEVNDLNIDRALHAHLERRTTMNQVCHVERLNEPLRTISGQGYPDASPYAQAQEHLLKDAMATMLSDRQGIMRVRRNPQFMDALDRNAVDVVATLTASDLLNEIDESRQKQVQFGYIRMGGFAYETPLLAEAPGVAPAQNENAGHVEGFLVEDQTEINLWSGLWFTNENNDYKEVPISLRGYWPVFDPALQEYIKLTITDPLGRNIFTDQRFIVRRVTFADLVPDGTTVTNLIIEKETDILIGSSVTIPLPPPPEAPPPPPSFPVITIDTPELAIVWNRAEVYRTLDFNAINPTWTDITGLPGYGGLEGVIFSVECDHFGGSGAWAVTGTDNVDGNDTANDVGVWWTPDVTIGAPVWTLVFSQFTASSNRTGYPLLGCDGTSARPNWGQLRSVVPFASGECITGEARDHGGSCFTVDTTTIYKVDSAGGFEVYNTNMYGPTSQGAWILECGQCGAGAPVHAGQKFVQSCPTMNQDDWRGCHQLYLATGGIAYLTAAGTFHTRDTTAYCNGAACDCGGCRNCYPWPSHPDTIEPVCGKFLNGSRHVLYHDGKWWAQAEQDVAATSAGSLYNSSDGEMDTDLWSNYGICNIASHSNHMYHCKQISAVTPRANELYIDGVASGVTSDLLFGGNGPGYNAGIIGHIRAIWDEDQALVLVKKEEKDGLQPSTNVVFTYDATNGLQNKTGNLSGVVWYGTGRALPPIGWNHRWDNVGFTAFQVPIR